MNRFVLFAKKVTPLWLFPMESPTTNKQIIGCFVGCCYSTLFVGSAPYRLELSPDKKLNIPQIMAWTALGYAFWPQICFCHITTRFMRIFMGHSFFDED
jgi:hypothetical protein